MKVSVITVCLNNKATIGATLKSVAQQTYPNIEHIIVDGVSTDGTLALIAEMAPDASVVSEKDKGIYDALNKGLARATGDVIGILHADDLYAHNEVIASVVEVMNANQSEAVYGDLVYVNRENPNQVTRFWKSGQYRPNSFLWGWMPPHPTFFVKKEIYAAHGVFNTALRSAADYELMLRFIHKVGIKLAYLPDVLVKMRVGGQSNVTLSNRLKANKEDRRAWDLNKLTPYWFTLYLKPLRKVSQFLFRS